MPEPPADRDLVSALRRVVVERLHYTYTIIDFAEFREDYRYVYSHARGMTVLPLVWRKQSTQANMVTVDSAHHNLVYLPSGMVTNTTVGVLESLGDDFREFTSPADLPRLGELLEQLKLGVGVGRPEDDKHVAAMAIDALSQLKVASDDGSSRKRKLISFAKSLENSYVPFVQLESPAADSLVFIHHGVDTFVPVPPGERESRLWRERLWFIVAGRIHFDVPLPLLSLQAAPWVATNSFHLRVHLPAGLHCDGPPTGHPRAAFEGTGIIAPNRTGSSEHGIYSYVSKSSMETLARQHREVTEKEITETVERVLRRGLVFGSSRMRRLLKLLSGYREDPKVRVGAKVAAGIRLTAFLLWVVVATEVVWSWTSAFSFPTFGILLSALVLVLLSGTGSERDTPLPRYMISWQAGTGTAIFLAAPTLRWALPRLATLVAHHPLTF